MIPDSKRTAFEGDSEDRISNLPRNVVNCILESLPLEDAARTSILSPKWRYVWASLPNLVLDKRFCHKFSWKNESIFEKMIDMILLQHLGDIVKFTLDVSETRLYSYTDIDKWMLYVTRNNVKELTLDFSNNKAYTLPSYMFDCQTLTILKLSNCVFKPPNSFCGFEKLITLILEKVTFMPTSELCVIKTPVLANLSLKYCDGAQYLNIDSPKLVCLINIKSPYLHLNNFLNRKTLRTLVLHDTVVDNKRYADRSTLEKLLSSRALLIVCLQSAFLEFLSAGTVTKELPFTLDCVSSLWVSANFARLGQTSYALQLIKCSPNLKKLEIWNDSIGDDAEAVLEYLRTPTFLGRPLDKLNHVIIYSFQGSKTELLLIKLLFAHAPSLVKMSIRQKRAFGSMEEVNITRELMRFPRASPRAELLYLP